MTRLWEDTDPETERVLLEMLAKAPAWRKLQMVGEMNRAVRELALIGLRRRHPVDTEEQIRRRLATLLLGDELAEGVWAGAGPLSLTLSPGRNCCTDRSLAAETTTWGRDRQATYYRLRSAGVGSHSCNGLNTGRGSDTPRDGGEGTPPPCNLQPVTCHPQPGTRTPPPLTPPASTPIIPV